MARTGRPRATNPASEIVKARLTKDELTALDEYCESNGINHSDAIRQALRRLLTDKNSEAKQ